jgi:hypothetical protein
VPLIGRVAARNWTKAATRALAFAAIFVPGVNRVADMGLKIAIPFEDIDLVSFAAAIRNTTHRREPEGGPRTPAGVRHFYPSGPVAVSLGKAGPRLIHARQATGLPIITKRVVPLRIP